MNMVLELQKAAYSTLSGDSTLNVMVSGVFDFVPQDAVYPYVTIGNSKAKDWSTISTAGIEVVLELEVYSRERGRKEALGILQRIRELLHQASLTVAGHTLVDIYCTESEVMQQKDGLTFKGIIRFIAHIQE